MSFILQNLNKAASSVFSSLRTTLQFKATNVIPSTTTTTNIIQTRNIGYINRMMLKDVKRREMLRKQNFLRTKYQALRTNTVLPKLIKGLAAEELHKFPLSSHLSHVFDRCAITSKAGGVFVRWRLSRIMWRLTADYNHMSGVMRAKWGRPSRNAICFTYKGYRAPWFNTEKRQIVKVIQSDGRPKTIHYRYPTF